MIFLYNLNILIGFLILSITFFSGVYVIAKNWKYTDNFLVVLVLFSIPNIFILFLFSNISILLENRIRYEFIENINTSDKIVLNSQNIDSAVYTKDSLLFYQTYFNRIINPNIHSSPMSDTLKLNLYIKDEKRDIRYYLMASPSNFPARYDIWMYAESWYSLVRVGVIRDDRLMYKKFNIKNNFY